MNVKRFMHMATCAAAVFGGGYVNAQVKISSADVIGLWLGMSFEQVQSTLKSLYPSHKLKVLNRRGGGAMGLAVEVESNSPKICSYGCPEHIQLNFGLASNRLWIIQRRVVAAEPVSPKVMTEELIKKYGTPTKIWALGFQVSTGVDGKPKEGCSGVLSSSERYKDCGFSFDASYSQNSPVTSYSVNFSNLGELWRDDEAGRAELAAASAEKNAEAIKRTSNNKPSL